MDEKLNIVKGNSVDPETRCAHYHTDLDIIAIKFKCCKEYYACYYCHQERSNHAVERWEQGEFNEKAVLCGLCKQEMTILDYLNSNNRCTNCNASFNPNCSKHHNMYFKMK